MGSDKINNGENPPASISLLQENSEFAFTNRQYDAADNAQMFSDRSSARACSVSFPNMSLPVDSSPWKNMHGAYQSHTHNDHETHGNMMVDLNQLHNLQNPLIDPNSINVSSNMTSLYAQNLDCPEGKMTGVLCTGNKIGTADNVMNDSTHFRSLQNPEINRNFPLIRGNAGGGYEMTAQGGEARISNIHGPQSKNFVGSTNMLHKPQHSRELSIGNCNEVCADEFSYLKKIDGRFLSLGIGGNTNANSDLSSREITRGLDRAALPQLNTSHVQQAIGSSLNLGHNLVGEFSSFQNDVGGLTSLGHHMGGWTSSNNNVGVLCGTDADLNPSKFHILQKLQADMQRGIVGNWDARYENLNPYKGLGEPATSSGPSSNSYGGLLDSGQTGASGLVSESVNPSWTTTQPTSEQLQKHFAEAVKNFSQESSSQESSMVSSVIRFKGSSTRQEHSGQSFPAFKDSAAQAVDESAQLPWRKPAGQLISTVKGCGLSQTSNVLGGPSFKGSEIRLPPAAPQVQRRKLTLQPPTLPSTTSPSHIAHVPRMKWQGRPQPFSTDLTGPSFATGLSQEGLPVHFSKDRLRPNSTTVTDQVISTAKECGFPQASNVLGGPSLKRSAIETPPVSSSVQRRKITVSPPFLPSMPSPSQATSPAPVTHIKWQGHPQPFASDLRVPSSFTTGQIISTAKDYRLCQASNVLSGPSLKRSAIQCLPAASRFQHSKFTFQQPILASMPSPIQTASGALIPAHLPHIKWEGLDGFPQPTGQKCTLCKRDLSFTPEGTVHQPTVPLAVAVLPCGHTFHDHCLQNITPEDQSKDPPCIPCAIGEI